MMKWKYRKTVNSKEFHLIYVQQNPEPQLEVCKYISYKFYAFAFLLTLLRELYNAKCSKITESCLKVFTTL